MRSLRHSYLTRPLDFLKNIFKIINLKIKKKNVELPNWKADKKPHSMIPQGDFCKSASLLSFTYNSPGIPFAISAPLGSICQTWKTRTGNDLFFCLEWEKSWWPCNISPPTPQNKTGPVRHFFSFKSQVHWVIYGNLITDSDWPFMKENGQRMRSGESQPSSDHRDPTGSMTLKEIPLWTRCFNSSLKCLSSAYKRSPHSRLGAVGDKDTQIRIPVHRQLQASWEGYRGKKPPSVTRAHLLKPYHPQKDSRTQVVVEESVNSSPPKCWPVMGPVWSGQDSGLWMPWGQRPYLICFCIPRTVGLRYLLWVFLVMVMY